MVADLMSRPPQAVPPTGPATVAGVKVPSGSLAASQEAGGTTGASLHLVAAVTAVDGVDLEAMAKDQNSCPSVQQLHNNKSLQLQVSTLGGEQLWCDVSTGRRWPLVPLSWRRKVFMAIHTLAHPGIQASRRLLSARFVWKCMASDAGSAANASRPRSLASQQPLYSPYQSPTAASPISAWTWITSAV